MDGQEKPSPKKHLIGMRTVKTAVAVFICCIIDFFRSVVPVQSTIAAIICMQPDVQDSVQTSISRIIATVLGGISAALTMFTFSRLGISTTSIRFYFIISLLLLPLIVITVKSGWPSATALTCVVFLVIALNSDDLSPFLIAGHRILDTFVGIAVALAVNLTLPTHHTPECGQGQTQAPPLKEAPVPQESVPQEDKPAPS